MSDGIKGYGSSLPTANVNSGGETGGSSDGVQGYSGGGLSANAAIPQSHVSHPGFLHFNDLTNAVGLGGAAHFVGKEIGTGAKDLENILIKGPIGLVENAPTIVEHPLRFAEQFGKGVIHDFSPDRLIHHPLYALVDATALLDFGASVGLRAADIGSIMARGGAPAAELVDAANAAKLGRESEFNRAVDPVTGVQRPVGQQIKDTLIHGRPAQQRIINLPKGDVGGPLDAHAFVPQVIGDYARSTTWRLGQKLVDRAHAAFPESRVPGIWKTQAGRAKAAERTANIYTQNALRRPGASLKALARGLSLPQQVAIRVVGEGASIPERIKFHEDQIASGDLTPRLVKESQKQITLLKQAEKYIEYKPIEGKTRVQIPGAEEAVDEANARPFTQRLFPHIKPEHEKLAHIVDASRHLARAREEIFGSFLHDSNSIGRKVNPLRVILGHTIPELPEKLEKEIANLKRLDKEGSHADAIAKAEARLVEAQKFEHSPAALGDEELSVEHLEHLFRVPYATRPAFRSLLGGSSRYAGGRVPPPSTVTHAFQGGYLKHGGGRNDVTNLLAESYTEAARFLILRSSRDRILQLAVHDPTELLKRGVKRENIVAVNTNVLQNGVGSDVMRQWRAGSHLEGDLTPDEAQAIGQQYDALRGEIFKDFNEALSNDPRYVFIDRRLLGGLDEPNPLTGINARAGGRQGVKFVDALNNSVKAAVLYLKPAYLFPNWLGNVALNMIHQGFAAPHNLYLAARLEHAIGVDGAGAVDALMGGGVTDILAPEGGRLQAISRGANKLGEFYGSGKINLGKKLGERKLFPGIDDPSRRSAFYFEAQRAGFTTAEHIKELVTDPKYRVQAETIAQRAAKEIIDYEDLGPIEQNIIRRVIFFYPWVKGATRYGFHFAQDHSIALAATAQLAQQGDKYQEEILGKLPAYMEGEIPLGHVKNNGNPVGINPSSASILQTPGELVEAIHNLFTGHPNKDLNLLQNLAPFEGGLFTAASGAPVSGPNIPGQTIAEKALSQLYGGLPLTTFIQALAHAAPPNRVYPGATGSYAGLPVNTWIALSRLLALGGGTPRPINRGAAYQSHLHETSGF